MHRVTHSIQFTSFQLESSSILIFWSATESEHALTMIQAVVWTASGRTLLSLLEVSLEGKTSANLVHLALGTRFSPARSQCSFIKPPRACSSQSHRIYSIKRRPRISAKFGTENVNIKAPPSNKGAVQMRRLFEEFRIT